MRDARAIPTQQKEPEPTQLHRAAGSRSGRSGPATSSDHQVYQSCEGGDGSAADVAEA